MIAIATRIVGLCLKHWKSNIYRATHCKETTNLPREGEFLSRQNLKTFHNNLRQKKFKYEHDILRYCHTCHAEQKY